jgi:hypothetical protein
MATPRWLVWPSTPRLFGRGRSTGPIASSSRRPSGSRSAWSPAKITDDVTTVTTRPRSSIRNWTLSDWPWRFTAAAIIALIRSNRATSFSAAARAWPARARSAAFTAAWSARCCCTVVDLPSTRFSNVSGALVAPPSCSAPVVPPNAGVGAPKPIARPLASWWNFFESTALIANMTMNSTMSSVIMSA